MSGATDERQKDHAGRQAFNAVFGDAITAIRVPDILVQFQYGVSAYDVKEALTGAGATSVTNATVELASGATGTAALESVSILRYQPGYEGYAYFTAAFPDGSATGSFARIGLFDSQNGYFLEHSGGVLYAVRRYGGTEERVSVADDQARNAPALDTTKINIFRISYGWLGVAPVVFEVYTGMTGGWIPLHDFSVLNVSTEPSTFQPALPMRAEVSTDGVAPSIRLLSCSWSAGRSGSSGNLPSDRDFGFTAAKAGVSAEVPIFTIKSEATFNGAHNHVTAMLDFLSYSAEGTKPTTFRIRRNATLTGASYSSVEAGSSVMSVDTSATATTGGSVVFPLTVAKSSSDKLFVQSLSLRIYPGETLTITAESAVSTDVTFTLLWRELF